MLQRAFHLEGKIEPCPGCGRQPLFVTQRGPDAYFAECNWCDLRTSKQASLQEAVQAWETQHHPQQEPETA